MKSSVKLIVLAAVAVLGILGIVLTLAAGLKPSVETDGKTMLVATAPYDLDLDSIVRGVLHDKLGAVIGVPFTVGLTKNYSHGYPEIIITSLDEIPASDDEVISTLNAAYPDLEIEAVDRFSFAPSHSRWFYYVCVLVVAAAFFAVVCMFFAMSGVRFSETIKWLIAACLSLSVSLLIGKIVGLREGGMTVLFALLSLVATSSVVFNSVFASENTAGNKQTSKLSGAMRYCIVALVLSAAAVAVTFFVGTVAGITAPLEVALVVCAAVIPSVAAAYVTFNMLLRKER